VNAMIDAQQKSREFIFGHISLYVNDMDKAVEFYTKILGMKLIKRRGETKQTKPINQKKKKPLTLRERFVLIKKMGLL
jgi:catechol-2,3-dioxygenase